MKIYDISWPISTATTAYKDKKTIHFEQVKSIDTDNARESVITLSSHSGTHVDAPSHFMRDGKTIDQIELSSIIGPCKVFDMSTVSDSITRDHLENLDISAGDIVLFKTTNSATQPTDKFIPHFINLEISGAQLLAQRKVRAVGIDYLGIGAHATHNALFEHNITIVEGLRLNAVKQGKYFLCCLPLHMIGLEAALARAVLLEGI